MPKHPQRLIPAFINMIKQGHCPFLIELCDSSANQRVLKSEALAHYEHIKDRIAMKLEIANKYRI